MHYLMWFGIVVLLLSRIFKYIEYILFYQNSGHKWIAPFWKWILPSKVSTSTLYNNFLSVHRIILLILHWVACMPSLTSRSLTKIPNKFGEGESLCHTLPLISNQFAVRGDYIRLWYICKYFNQYYEITIWEIVILCLTILEHNCLLHITEVAICLLPFCDVVLKYTYGLDFWIYFVYLHTTFQNVT